MKKILLSLLAITLVIASIASFASCNQADTNETTVGQTNDVIEATGLWANATYLENVTLGTGSKTVKLDVEAQGQKITITLNTDKATLGEAMYEHELINDPAFFDILNGIKADWNKDNAYWGFYQGEDFMMVGVNDTNISGGEHYRFVYTK